MRAASIAAHLHAGVAPRPFGLGIRLRARLRAGRYDRELDTGVAVLPGSALALHRARIVAPADRRRLADALASRLDRARAGHCTRIPLQRKMIIAESALIDDIVARFRGPDPVRARGVARLRMLLTDGTGPLYTTGSVAAALRGVSAAL